MSPRPFQVAVPEAALVDLRARLGATRSPPAIPGSDTWELGTEETTLRRLVARWADGYAWRAHERAMNELPHFASSTASRCTSCTSAARGRTQSRSWPPTAAGVTTRLAARHPEAVRGIHLLAVGSSPLDAETRLSASERAYLADVERWEREEGG